MAESETLIAFIAAGIVAAFGLGLVAHRLGASPVAGYLLAGILIGPYTPGFVADDALAREIADIGVTLIMFGLGLKFSVSTLLAFRWRPIVGAGLQMLAVTGIGHALGMRLGLASQESLIFGFSLSVASTVVLLRALEDRALLTSRTGAIAVSWVLVQNVATILALAVMPVLARAWSTEMPAPEIAAAIASTGIQVALFVTLMLVAGRRLLQPLLTFLMKAQAHELFSLGVLAMALGIAYLAHKVFGVSLALGAFFAGLVLNETHLSRRAAENTRLLREAFAVLFFVCVGLLFDPVIVLTHGWAIAAVLAVIVIGNGLAGFLIMTALRMPLRKRLIVAAGVAQIGEFSFLVTGFALALGLISPETQALTLAGAFLAIALNPLLLRAGDALAPRLDDAAPAKPARGDGLSMPGRPR